MRLVRLRSTSKNTSSTYRVCPHAIPGTPSRPRSTQPRALFSTYLLHICQPPEIQSASDQPCKDTCQARPGYECIHTRTSSASNQHRKDTTQAIPNCTPGPAATALISLLSDPPRPDLFHHAPTATKPTPVRLSSTPSGPLSRPYQIPVQSPHTRPSVSLTIKPARTLSRSTPCACANYPALSPPQLMPDTKLSRTYTTMNAPTHGTHSASDHPRRKRSNHIRSANTQTPRNSVSLHIQPASNLSMTYLLPTRKTHGTQPASDQPGKDNVHAVPSANAQTHETSVSLRLSQQGQCQGRTSCGHAANTRN